MPRDGPWPDRPPAGFPYYPPGPHGYTWTKPPYWNDETNSPDPDLARNYRGGQGLGTRGGPVTLPGPGQTTIGGGGLGLSPVPGGGGYPGDVGGGFNPLGWLGDAAESTWNWVKQNPLEALSIGLIAFDTYLAIRRQSKGDRLVDEGLELAKADFASRLPFRRKAAEMVQNFPTTIPLERPDFSAAFAAASANPFYTPPPRPAETGELENFGLVPGDPGTRAVPPTEEERRASENVGEVNRRAAEVFRRMGRGEPPFPGGDGTIPPPNIDPRAPLEDVDVPPTTRRTAATTATGPGGFGRLIDLLRRRSGGTTP